MLKKKLLNTIQRETLIKEGDKVLVAFSGGPDSSCLLHILASLQEELGIELYSAHLNHQIRGLDAHQDALLAYRESTALGVPCFLSAVDVPLYAREKKLSLEEAAREVRYHMLFEVKEKLAIDKIAVAHNLDDQAETVLMRIMRGTGLNGLKGMAYKREDGVIRPLMDIKRQEIEDYCAEHQLHTALDKTNEEDEYTRNKIRLLLLPYIEENYASNIKEILSRMSNSLREDSDYIDNIATELYREIGMRHEDYAIKFEMETIESFAAPILKRLIRQAYVDLMGTNEGLEAVHMEDALKVINSPRPELSVNLPKGIIVEKKGYNLYVSKKPLEIKTVNFEYEIPLGGSIELAELGIKIETKIMSKERCKLLPSRANTKAFDLDKIQGKLIVRNRKAGDKIKPIGFGGTKKLKDIFIDKKIPRDARERIPIIADESKIIWIVGHDMGEESKIEETTKEVVRITVKPIEN